MWVASNGCDQDFHLFKRDAKGKWEVLHSDRSLCGEVEFNFNTEDVEAELIEEERHQKEISV
jgi:hypothetical protein